MMIDLCTLCTLYTLYTLSTGFPAPPEDFGRCPSRPSLHGGDEGVSGLESRHLAQRFQGVIVDLGVLGQGVSDVVHPELIDPFIEILAVDLIDETGDLVDRDAEFGRQVADAVATPQEWLVSPEMGFQGLTDGVCHGR